MTQQFSSWGRLGQFAHQSKGLSSWESTLPGFDGGCAGLAYGNGRSYGDVCLNPAKGLWLTKGLDRLLSFDEKTGVLECQAGVLLRDIQRLLVPRGWMLAVTPGTQLITVGGAIANDVHGKNHYRVGSFGDHVLNIVLQRTDGETIECSPTERPEWFAATVGGLGLTGVILQVQLRLHRIPGAWLETETIPYPDLPGFFTLADDSEAMWEHTVSWIDCISGGHGGRGVFMRGNHSARHSDRCPTNKQLAVPLVPPISLINRYSLRIFNTAYFHMQTAKAGQSLVHYEKFF